ncbi:MAG: glycosyltransferase [Anaerolineae bacterium]|nr:glycosyltransferase [Anaerolineae bacterium]
MKILFPYLARWRSANWTRYHQLLGELARQGHDVIVFEPPPRPSHETNYTELPVPLPPRLQVRATPIPAALWQRPLPLDKLVKKGLVAVLSQRSVARAVREERPDALLLYNIPQAGLVDLPTRVVFDIADDLVTMLDFELGPLARWGPRQAAGRLYRHMLDRAVVVTTCSAGLQAEMGRPATLVPNGVAREEIALADGRAVRAQFRTPIVGFLGAFEYFVNFELVLDAAARQPDVTFLLVGGGRAWAAVKAQVEVRRLANVVLPGPVPHATGLDYVAAIDVTLIPFSRDRVSDFAVPLKLFEYMALGKPVITTPGHEIQRIAGPYVTVVHTVDEMVAAIRQDLAGGAEVRARVAAGQALVEEHYTWDCLAETFLQALTSA